jgi:lipoprotein-anchoring transpeptidase ErfK/SrfK
MAAAISAMTLASLTACNGAGGAAAAKSSAAAALPPAKVTFAVADNATGISPTVPLELTVADGSLDGVALTAKDGTTVTGTLTKAADHPGSELWTPDQQLDYGTTYTLTARTSNAAHRAATASSTFTTVAPATLSTPSVGPLGGTTVGVGMPIRLYFDQPVADRAAVQSHLKVTSSHPTDGTWSWLNDKEVHFRPSTYWPPDTHVTLDATLYGVDFGDGVWGQKNRTVSFDIGARHVSVADAASHMMAVYDGNKLVQNFPMSAGSAKNPTRNGPHVVLQSYRKIVMDSSTFGLAVDAPGGYRANVEYAVRISNNGEFVHAAPWSVAQQGNSNVSHGCINLSTSRAAWFYNFAKQGDVVEVKNSLGPTLSAVDGDIYDWAIPWAKWKAGSALK